MASHNFTTFVQAVAARMGKTASTDIEHIKRSMISAIRFYRDTRFDFNEATGTFSTVDGQAVYDNTDYPSKLLYIDVAEITVSGGMHILTAKTMGEIRGLRYASTDKSIPYCYSWSRRVLDIYPTPDAIYTITLDYVKDIGTPSYEYDGTDWNFYDQEGVAITDSWTSSWLTDGHELLTSRVEWDLWTHIYKDLERGAFSKRHEQEALTELQGKRSRPQATVSREMYL
jgi:hypothetical protein